MKSLQRVIPILFLICFSVWCDPQTAVGQNPTGPAIKEIKGLQSNDLIFQKSNSRTPIIISNEVEAKQYFSQGEIKKLKGKVEFGNQVLLVFGWSGSGQDKLDYSVMESYPEQIAFKLTPGRTRDLRRHVRCFAVRSNVIWKGKPVGRVKAPEPKEYIKVVVKGKLDSNVLAIGGETTGFQITANGITWELEFGKNEKAKRFAKSLDGKVVTLSGKLNVKSGVEIKKRWIVTVDELQDAPRPAGRKR